MNKRVKILEDMMVVGVRGITPTEIAIIWMAIIFLLIVGVFVIAGTIQNNIQEIANWRIDQLSFKFK